MRTTPGADINSDHDLALCNMKLKLPTKKKSKNSRVRFDVEEYNEEISKQ